MNPPSIQEQIQVQEEMIQSLKDIHADAEGRIDDQKARRDIECDGMHGCPAEAVDRVEIRPRARGDGWSLLTDGLALWYRDDLLAIEYAHHWLRESGGMVWVTDHQGFPIVSEFVPKGGHSVMAQAAGGRR